jgi:hypothetical protein
LPNASTLSSLRHPAAPASQQPLTPKPYRAIVRLMPGHKKNLPAPDTIKTRFNLPIGFHAWNPIDKLQFAFNASLDTIATILSWDPNGLDDNRIRVQKEIAVAVVNVTTKYGIARARTDANTEALAEIREGLAKRTIDTAKLDC